MAKNLSADRERQIGEAVAKLRGDTSQQAVAESMRLRGWKWSQATVWSVEKGDRPLRLAEAQDLANVFGVSVSQLLEGDSVAAALGKLRAQALLSRDAIEQHTVTLARIRTSLPLLAEVGGEHQDRISSILTEIGTPEDAVSRGHALIAAETQRARAIDAFDMAKENQHG